MHHWRKFVRLFWGAVVRGVHTGTDEDEHEAFIKALMDHQEKLHFALGRGRKRASIGVHDLSVLSPPFKVKTVPSTESFTPPCHGGANDHRIDTSTPSERN